MAKTFEGALKQGTYDYSQGIQDALHGGRKPEKFRPEDHHYKKGFEAGERSIKEHEQSHWGKGK